MQEMIPEVINERFSIADPCTYFLYGLWPQDAVCRAVMAGEQLPVEKKAWNAFNAADRFDIQNSEQLESVQMIVTLPKKLPEGSRLEIFAEKDGKTDVWFTCGAKQLQGKRVDPQVFLDQVKRPDRTSVTMSGWTVSASTVRIEAVDKAGNPIAGQVSRFPRMDVAAAFPEIDVGKDCGFQLTYKNIVGTDLFLRFISDNGTTKVGIPMLRRKVLAGEIQANWIKGTAYLKTHGFRKFCWKIKDKLLKKDRPVEYSDWIRFNFASDEDLKEQRAFDFEMRPLISIVVPLYKTPANFLDALVRSVKEQSYDNWELVLSDGSGTPSPIAGRLKELAEAEPRIRVVEADTPHRIVANTNRAIEAASGDYIAFADHDDLLAPDALFECVKAINQNPETELLYTDEDKTDITGINFFEPQMKPDFNLDLLRTVNYICHLCLMKKSLLEKIGYLDEAYEGAQDYDIILRAVENTDQICHVPKVLYHWRTHADSTSENPESKKYAFDAGRRAIQAHFDRLGIAAEVYDGEWPGLYRTRYVRAYDPLISILIPNKDHTDDLKRCIDSIMEKSTYQNFEILVIENNSDKEETFAYYKKLEAENEKVRVLYYKGDFNFSRINNFAAAQAKGEYLLLLNNDTSLINGDALEELLGYCMREDVGAVGARLYYEDDTIQHAGVVVGFGGIAGHCFVMHPRGSTGYCHRIICAQDYSAVTAACVLVDRKVYEEVGGLDEEYAVAFNDIDFCLRIREKGYLIVYNPYAELYHYESKSRGLEDTPQKLSRFNTEIDIFRRHWEDFLQKGDPYYSPNLTLDAQDFSLRKNF